MCEVKMAITSVFAILIFVHMSFAWVRFREPLSRRNFLNQTLLEKLQNCAGKEVHECGLCGEGPGEVQTHVIPTENYTVVDPDVRVLAVSLGFRSGLNGYLEFRVCNVTDNSTNDAMTCNKITPLLIGSNETWYPSLNQSSAKSRFRLPRGLVCERCVLQVKYTPGLNSTMKDFRFYDCALLNISHPTKTITNTIMITRSNQHSQVFPPNHSIIDRRHGSAEQRSANTFQSQGQDIMQTINTTFNTDRRLHRNNQLDSDTAGTVTRRSNMTIKQIPSVNKTASVLIRNTQVQGGETIKPSATHTVTGSENKDRTVVVRTFNISRSDGSAASSQTDNLARVTVIDIQGNKQAATNMNNIAENQINDVNNMNTISKPTIREKIAGRVNNGAISRAGTAVSVAASGGAEAIQEEVNSFSTGGAMTVQEKSLNLGGDSTVKVDLLNTGDAGTVQEDSFSKGGAGTVQLGSLNTGAARTVQVDLSNAGSVRTISVDSFGTDGAKAVDSFNTGGAKTVQVDSLNTDSAKTVHEDSFSMDGAGSVQVDTFSTTAGTGAVQADSFNTMNVKVNNNKVTNSIGNTGTNNQQSSKINGIANNDAITYAGGAEQNATRNSKTETLFGQNNKTIERAFTNVSTQGNNSVGIVNGNYSEGSQGYYDETYYYYNDTGAYNDSYLYYDESIVNYNETYNNSVANILTDNTRNVSEINAVSTSNADTTLINETSGGYKAVGLDKNISVKNEVLETNALTSSRGLTSSNTINGNTISITSSNTINEYPDIKSSLNVGNENNRTYASIDDTRMRNGTLFLNKTVFTTTNLHKPEIPISNETFGLNYITPANDVAAINTSILAQEIVNVPSTIIVLPEPIRDNLSKQYVIENDSNQTFVATQDLKQDFDTTNTEIGSVQTIPSSSQSSSVIGAKNSLPSQNYTVDESKIVVETNVVQDIPLGWNEVGINKEHIIGDSNTPDSIHAFAGSSTALDMVDTNVSNSVGEITTNLHSNEISTESSPHNPVKRLLYSVSAADRRPQYADLNTLQSSSNIRSNEFDVGVPADSSNIKTNTFLSQSKGLLTIANIENNAGTSRTSETVSTKISKSGSNVHSLNNMDLTRTISDTSAFPERVYTERLAEGTMGISNFNKLNYADRVSTSNSDTSDIFKNAYTETLQEHIPTISGLSKSVNIDASIGNQSVISNRSVYSENANTNTLETASVSSEHVYTNDRIMGSAERSAFPGRVYADIPDLFATRTFTNEPFTTRSGIHISKQNTLAKAQVTAANSDNLERQQHTDSSKSDFDRVSSTSTLESLPNFSVNAISPGHESGRASSPSLKLDHYIGLPSTTVDPLDRVGSTFVRMVNYSEVTSDSVFPAPKQDISSISDIVTPGRQTNTESNLMAVFSSTPTPQVTNTNFKSTKDIPIRDNSAVEDRTSFSNFNFLVDSGTRVDGLGGVPVHSRPDNLNTNMVTNADSMRRDSAASVSHTVDQSGTGSNKFIRISNFDITNTLNHRYDQVNNQNSKTISAELPITGLAIPVEKFNPGIDSGLDKTFSDNQWNALQIDNFTFDTSEMNRPENRGELVIGNVAMNNHSQLNNRTNYEGGKTIVWQSMNLSNVSNFNKPDSVLQSNVPLDTLIKSTRNIGLSINNYGDFNKIKSTTNINTDIVARKGEFLPLDTLIKSTKSIGISMNRDAGLNKITPTAYTNRNAGGNNITLTTNTNTNIVTRKTENTPLDISVNGLADLNTIASSRNANTKIVNADTNKIASILNTNRNIVTMETENLPINTVFKSNRNLDISVNDITDINKITSATNANRNIVTTKKETIPLDTFIKSTKTIDVSINDNAGINTITPSLNTNTETVAIKTENIPLDTPMISANNLDIYINGNADVNKITSITNTNRRVEPTRADHVPDIMPPITAKTTRTFANGFKRMNDQEQNKVSVAQILLPPKRNITLFTPYLVIPDTNQVLPNIGSSNRQSAGINARVDDINFSNTILKSISEPSKTKSLSTDLSMTALWDINRGNANSERGDIKFESAAIPAVQSTDNSNSYVTYNVDKQNENALHSKANEQPKYAIKQGDIQNRTNEENRSQKDVHKQVLRTLEALVLELGAMDNKASQTEASGRTSSIYRDAADSRFRKDEFQSSLPLFSVHQRLLTIPNDAREWRYSQRNSVGQRGAENHRLLNRLGVSNQREWNTGINNINTDNINNTNDTRTSEQAVINISKIRTRNSDLFARLSDSFADISLRRGLHKNNGEGMSGPIVQNQDITTVSPTAKETNTQTDTLTVPLENKNNRSVRKNQAVIQSVGSSFFNPFTGETITWPGQGKQFNDTFIARGIGNLQHLKGIEKQYSASFLPNLTVEQYNFAPNVNNPSNTISIEGKYMQGQMRRNEMGQFEPVPIASRFDTISAEKKISEITAFKDESKLNNKHIIAKAIEKDINSNLVNDKLRINGITGTINDPSIGTERSFINTMPSLKLFDINPNTQNGKTNIIRPLREIRRPNTRVTKQDVPSSDKYFFSQTELLKTNGISLNPIKRQSLSAELSQGMTKNSIQSMHVDKPQSCNVGELFVCNAVGETRDVPGMVWWCFSHCKNGVCPPEQCSCRCEKIREVQNTANVSITNSANISRTRRKEKVIQLTLNTPKENSVAVSKISNRRLDSGITMEAKSPHSILNTEGNNIRRTNNSLIQSEMKSVSSGNQVQSPPVRCKGINAFADTTGINELCTKMCSQNICPEAICMCL